ncbi:MAG: DUF3524 domain-containing protein [Planctomycetes bacterium]|jgi:glycosyltransferase involved in cell wall biosynthesis|nr:DUF3524 domain-containing protein [Planctomycetota bacterium]
MRILAVEPYYGGSHQAFIEGWRSRSEHAWTVLTAPPHGWKWRMRHAAITFAEEARTLLDAGEWWDVLLCSDMLNLAEFVGLCPPAVGRLPRVAYFHENQLSYPVRHDEPRDVHFGMINMSTAMAADAVWFNSTFHREEFLRHLHAFLRTMRPPQMLEQLDVIRERSAIEPPGIDVGSPPRHGAAGPLHIGWAARWEHDKRPEMFFAAMDGLLRDGVECRVSVIGEQFSDVPPVFTAARQRLGSRVVRWGYQPDRASYRQALAEMDVAVSTAEHEFFGLGMLEAGASGAAVLLPQRLAYPEVFGPADGERSILFYDGEAASLTARLRQLARRAADGDDLQAERRLARQAAQPYDWSLRATAMDAALTELAGRVGRCAG